MDSVRQYYYNNFTEDYIPTSEISRFLKRAYITLKAITFSRIDNVIEEDTVKQCICEVCEVLYKHEMRDGIKSENNDGYSVTYDESEMSKDKEIKRIAELYLGPMGLMYAGVQEG